MTKPSFEIELVQDPPAYITEAGFTDLTILRPLGNWRISHDLSHIDHKLRQKFKDLDGHAVTVDLSGLTDLDTNGAMILQRTMQDCGMRQTYVNAQGISSFVDDGLNNFSNASDIHQTLIVQAGHHLSPCEIEEIKPNPFIVMLDRMGRALFHFAEDTAQLLGFMAEVMTQFVRSIAKPSRFRWTPIVHHMETAGINAIPIVCILTFAIGAVIAFMGTTVLAQFGAEIFVVEMVGIIVLREFGVLLTAILLAGRSGSAFTAQIGSMKLREEIDAMRVMGINPIDALVIPRITAMLLTVPLLTFLASMMGIFGGGAVAWLSMDISPNLFLTRTQDVIVLSNFWVGLIKAPFFAIIIAVVGCFQGMSVEGNAEDLGKRTTKSVIHSLFLIIILDALFAIFFMQIDF